MGTVPEHMIRILKVANVYFDKDENPTDVEAPNKGKEMGNTEDTLVKLIRLVANICTDEQYVHTLIKAKDGK